MYPKKDSAFRVNFSQAYWVSERQARQIAFPHVFQLFSFAFLMHVQTKAAGRNDYRSLAGAASASITWFLTQVKQLPIQGKSSICKLLAKSFNLNHSAMPRQSVEITQTAGGIWNTAEYVRRNTFPQKAMTNFGEFLHSQVLHGVGQQAGQYKTLITCGTLVVDCRGTGKWDMVASWA